MNSVTNIFLKKYSSFVYQVLLAVTHVNTSKVFANVLRLVVLLVDVTVLSIKLFFFVQ